MSILFNGICLCVQWNGIHFSCGTFDCAVTSLLSESVTESPAPSGLQIADCQLWIVDCGWYLVNFLDT